MRNALNQIFVCVSKAKLLQKMKGGLIFRMTESLHLWKFQLFPRITEDGFTDLVSIALMLKSDIRYETKLGKLVALPDA